MEMKGFQELGVPFEGPYSKYSSIWGLHWGPPTFGNYNIIIIKLYIEQLAFHSPLDFPSDSP